MTYKNTERRKQNYREWYQKNREKVLLANKIWRQNNREKEIIRRRIRYQENREKILAQNKAWVQKNRVRANIYKKNWIAKKFGVQYPTWWLCDGCSKPISLVKGEIYLDHDHKTEKFRAWLCQRCNVGLGVLDTLDNWQIERLLGLVK